MAINYEKNLFQCAKCGWVGKHLEKKAIQNKETRYSNIVCPNCSAEEFYLVKHSTLRFIELGFNQCKLDTQAFPSNPSPQTDSISHALMLSVAHIFSQDLTLLLSVATYLSEGGDLQKLHQFLDVGVAK